MNSARLVEQWEQRLLRRGKAEGRREGKAEGKAEGLREGEARGKSEGKSEGLRTAVVALCEVLGIALPPTRQARLGAMTADELEALCQHLQRERRWPRRGER